MYFTVTVDTEEEWDWGDGWPTSRPQVTNIQALPRFQQLCARYGARPTYFVNLAVLEDPKACAVILDLASRDDCEIGMHIHPWNTPPILDHRPATARDTFLHNLREDLITAKLTSVYNRFLELGLRPTSFRGGRYSSGGQVTQFLQDHGFKVDASVLPMTTWPDDGAPDYRRRDLLPRRLAPSREGELPLWEIPLTLGFTRKPLAFWRRWYEAIEASWLSKLRLIGIGERLGIVRRVWLNFESPLGEHMLKFLPLLRKMQVPCACFTVHSSSLVAGPGPYTRTSQDEDRIFRQITGAFQWVATNADFIPTTMTDLAHQLEGEYHACTRN
ncbi:MAG TPA: hypothetical protein VMV10_20610 [Pirellulales bacterium]|nr:hypothetical protein [Pirellulales bacterium]